MKTLTEYNHLLETSYLSEEERLAIFCNLMNISSKIYHANPINPTKIGMDITNQDVQNLLHCLNLYQVKYLLVGGMAGVFHGHIRTTQDMDLWVKSGNDNKLKLIAALQEAEIAGAEYLKNTPLLFGWTSVRFGKSGFELDLGEKMKAFTELDFDACFERKIIAEIDNVKINVIHINDLLEEKRTNPRPKDLLDAEELQKIIEIQKRNS